MVKADFLTSLVLIALGIAVAVESWRMPRLAELGVNPYTVPGLVPGVLAGVLIVLGMILCLRSVRANTVQAPVAQSAGATSPHFIFKPGPAVRRLGLCLLLTLGYAAVLVGRLPFWLATLLFVFAFIVLFESQTEYRVSQSHAPVSLTRRLASALLQAIVVAVAVSAIFRYLFLVQLP